MVQKYDDGTDQQQGSGSTPGSAIDPSTKKKSLFGWFVLGVAIAIAFAVFWPK